MSRDTRRSWHGRARIVATLGPASSSATMVARLVRAGVDVVRLNFSHGTHEEHRRTFETVRRVERDLGACVAVLQDLSGPKLRVARLEGPELRLRRGRAVSVLEGRVRPRGDVIVVEAAGALAGLEPGRSIRLADGLIELRVTGAIPGGVACEVVHGGVVRPRQGVNLPGARLGVRAFTARDRRDLAFGLELGVDAVALSFVSDGDDVRRAWRFCQRRGRHPFLVAKIERAEALAHLDDILEACSGVMVARGDLGVEIGAENVPLAQRTIVARARARHRPVITATQMLESMIENATPTRAEVSDVANAVLEGADGLMLSGETAVGRHPVAAVRTLVRVSRRTAETAPAEAAATVSDLLAAREPTEAVARAARLAARAVGAEAIVAFSDSGRTVRLVASQRPRRRLVGVTSRRDTWRRMRLMWGVTPLLVPRARRVDDLIASTEAVLRERRLVRRGAVIVIVCGESVVSGGTNTVKIHRCDQPGSPRSRKGSRAGPGGGRPGERSGRK